MNKSIKLSHFCLLILSKDFILLGNTIDCHIFAALFTHWLFSDWHCFILLKFQRQIFLCVLVEFWFLECVEETKSKKASPVTLTYVIIYVNMIVENEFTCNIQGKHKYFQAYIMWMSLLWFAKHSNYPYLHVLVSYFLF